MKAHRRPVSGCGSQRMLHALERRSHSADHGPSFASLYSPFCRYATSSPDRGKSLLAGGGQLSCNSRTGQIKNALAHCSGSNHIRHSYRMGLATTTTAASGRCREKLLGQRPARRKCRPRHARMLGAATRGTKQQPTGLIAYPAARRRPVSGCGSQRMLHALERRSHSADHGPSFASLYSPFCRYATSSPDRGKSLLAGGGQLSCNSRTGQIKNALAHCSGSNHIRHSYRMGPEH